MTHATSIIAITGGIGSGKSVVSRILRTMGYSVYDCDSEAKRLMDESAEIRARIRSEISAEAINPDGTINRQRLAETVFADAAALEQLNSMVHSAVRDHIASWTASVPRPCFIETAIPYQSGIDAMVDAIWEVDAPEEVRITRVMARNGMTRGQVQSRIASQSFTPRQLHPHTIRIDNSPTAALLPQILHLLGK